MLNGVYLVQRFSLVAESMGGTPGDALGTTARVYLRCARQDVQKLVCARYTIHEVKCLCNVMRMVCS